jgi:hypothetical protein
MKEYRVQWGGCLDITLRNFKQSVTVAHSVVQMNWVTDREESWPVGRSGKGAARRLAIPLSSRL